MKKGNLSRKSDMRPTYKRSDFGTLVRGKYAQRLRESSNVVVIEPDLAKVFPDAAAVNKALRRLLREGNDTPRRRQSLRRGGGRIASHRGRRISIVVLDPDVCVRFPNEAAVNAALRSMVDTIAAGRRRL